MALSCRSLWMLGFEVFNRIARPVSETLNDIHIRLSTVLLRKMLVTISSFVVIYVCFCIIYM